MVSFSQSSEQEFREQFILFLVEHKGYPRGLITTEMPLSYVQAKKGHRRDRRVDILIFACETCHPLVLIECKKNIPKATAIHQLLGYNFHVQAPWCALVWPQGYTLYGANGITSGVLFDFPEYKSFLNFLSDAH